MRVGSDEIVFMYFVNEMLQYFFGNMKVSDDIVFKGVYCGDIVRGFV